MSAHRRVTPPRTKLRRTLTAAVVAAASGLGVLVGATPAFAAGPWFVNPLGLNTNSCLTAAAPCATIGGVLAKPAFVSGDTINLAAGTYLDRTTFTTKGANIVGTGTNAIYNSNNVANQSVFVINGAGLTVNFSNMRITGGNAGSLFGGGIRVTQGTANVTNVSIDGNKAQVGGGVYVAPNQTFTATDSNLNSNTVAGANGSGGGIFNNSGSATILRGTISSNTVTAGGGAIGGGGIYSAGGTTNVTNTTVASNSGPLGGGAAAVTLNANGVTWQSNTATSGGALFSNSGANTISITGGSFTGNTAPTGAGVYNAGGTTTVSGASFSTNNATTSGGAVYQTGTTTVTNLIGNTINGNTSPLGAGLYVNQGTVNVGNNTANSGGSITNNNASNVGGAAYVATASGISGTLNLKNAAVTGNTGVNGGGAIGSAGVLNVTSSNVSNNTGNLGGGILNTGPTTVTGSTVGANTGGAGGGIYSTANLTVTDSQVTGNNLTGAVANQSGGGIYSTGTANITNSNVSNNTSANQGGGITSSGPLTLTDSTVNTNTAATGAGLVASGTTTINRGSVNLNTAQSSTAAANAGGMFVTGVTTIDGTLLNGNKAVGGSAASSGNAGAIYFANVLNLKNATLDGNSVTQSTNTASGSITGYGGAIFGVTFAAAVTPTLNVTNTAINGGNVSGGNAFIGGAVAMYPNTISGGTTGIIDATGLTLSKNVAAAAGGIYSVGKITLKDSTLDQNQANHATAGNGGAVYAGSSPIVLDNTDVTGNTATTSGGGLFVLAGSTTEIRNGSTLSGNTADSGGALVTGGLLTVKDSAVDNNNASVFGAGLYLGGNTTVQNSSIDGNSAAGFGGGVFQAGGSFAMTGGHVSGNDAYAGGGVLVGANLLSSFDGTDLKNNVATGIGGGAIANAGQMSLKNGTLSGNTANATNALGGAIFSGSDDDNVTTSLKLDSVTLTANEAFAASALVVNSTGASSTNKTSIDNSTIVGNTSSSTVGAIYQVSPLTLTNSTVTGNTATGTGAVGGVVSFNRAGLGLAGNVFADNTGVTCFRKTNAPADNTNPADGGYNHLPTGDTSCNLSSHVQSGDPKLAALADNGGPTFTRLPSTSSPLLDKVPAGTPTGFNDAITGSAVTLCAAGAKDQRGENRPAGAKCDIGSVEKVQVAPTINGPASATYSVGNPGTPLDYTTTGSPQPTLSATGLPAGVTLVDHGDGTGTISGTPAAGTGGVYNVTVKATNEAGTATTPLTLTVNQAPVIGGPSAATYTVGQPGSTLFTQTSGNPLGTFSSTGALPGGITFDGTVAGQGTYSGTPAGGSGGIYNLTVKDDNGTPPAATAPFTLTVNEAAGLTGPGTATFQVGTASQSGEYTATGFPVPTLSATGLPSGLTLASTGTGKVKISGNAANGTGGLYNATVKAANGVAADATVNVAVTVNEAPELVGPSVARWVTGSANSVGFVSDGYPQATLTKTGALPASLTFTDNGNGTATISGTTSAADVGTYAITVKASNGIAPDVTQNVTIEVVPPLSITTTSLGNAAFRTAYSQQVMVAGGQPPYTFSISAGSLPAGLTMNSAGLITGSTTANTGTYTFTVKATDSLDPSQTSTKQLSITVVKGDTTMFVTAIVAGIQPNGDLSINVGLVEADIKGGFPLLPVAGVSVKFTSGSKTVCTGVSDANGHAQCSQNVLDALLTPLKGSLTATFAGNANWNGSAATAGALQPGTSGSSGGGSNPLAWLFGG